MLSHSQTGHQSIVNNSPCTILGSSDIVLSTYLKTSYFEHIYGIEEALISIF